MGLKVIEVQDDSEFHELSVVERLAFEDPECKLMELYFPTHGKTDKTSREACIQEAADRQIAWHRADPTSHWIKVVDEETGALVGAALWHIYDSNPYAPNPDEEEHGCTWFPEGEERDVANGLIGQFFTPRMTYMTKPHVFLDIFFTHPSHRRRGAGALMMEWGNAEADKRDYVAYIDATDMGKALYLKTGYKPAQRHAFSTAEFPRTERVKDVEARLVPFEWWPMYRPVQGKWGDGVLAPWEKEDETKVNANGTD